ncbi:uncharacterized protein LODBEIA_P03830 [Lodderomyces beijingensis]|uniref:Enhancer of translation termination 1 n=1 Tax=Lodderomyces beijingensis TaxID=1775926 RepID=A0ABP0ZDA4_9ASCO
MAKRTLGMGNAAKAKKQKTLESKQDSVDLEAPSQPTPPKDSNQLTVELPEEVDADDEISQLKGLYKTYIDSERDSDLILNGIIHECDRLLRNSQADSKEPLAAIFYKIYAIALSESANFHTDAPKKVSEFFDAAIERIEDGLEKFPRDIDLLFTKSKILVNRIALEKISQLTLESRIEDEGVSQVKRDLDEALQIYEDAELRAQELGEFAAFNSEEYWDILEAVDDLLDIVDNFGKDDEQRLEDDDDDDEEEAEAEEAEKAVEEELNVEDAEKAAAEEEEGEDEEDEDVELAESHPLYAIKNTDEYNQWWRDHTTRYLANLLKTASPSPSLRRQLNARLGQSFLQEAEIPSSVYTTLKFDEDYQGIEELEGLNVDEAKDIAQDLISKALQHLKEAEDKDEPESWVAIAEAMISLGNLHDVDSKEQESLYEEAEKLLNKANNATNGKYQDALENLIG